MNPQTMSRKLVILMIVLTAVVVGARLARAAPASADDPVIYVDAGAAAGGDGESWSTAYRHLQDALDEASAKRPTRLEIWVASGVYTPDEDDDGDHADDVVTETFRIVHNGVQLYGGFAGGETSRDQRDWDANATVLSGDLDGNDLTDERGVVLTTTHIVGRNAYHVIWLDGETYEALTDSTIIDGFIITAGHGDGVEPDDRGGGLYCNGEGSGSTCSPKLANLSFSGNRADWGGGMYNSGGRQGVSSPSLTRVAFGGNSAQNSGGAMYNWGWNDGTSSPRLVNVSFKKNGAERGAGMFNFGCFHGASSPSLTNVAFIDNAASGRGGGLYADGVGGESNPMLTNVTFTGNSAHSGAAVYASGQDGESSPHLTNVILWGNRAAWRGDQMVNDSATPAIGHSLVEGGWNGDGVHNIDSTVTDEGGNIDDDPEFLAPEEGNARLTRSSPCIDAGDNDGVPAGVITDLAGNPRFVDIVEVGDTGRGTPPIVDIGAHEVQIARATLYLPLVVRS